MMAGVDEVAGSRWNADLTASLVGAARPAAVLQAAALCMAEELASDGFRWIKARKSLERRDEVGRWERIRLEPSYWNRSGTLIEFAVAQLIVEDAALGRWRTANHLRTVVRGESVVNILCATSCYDMSRVGFKNTVILTQPESRAARLSALCDQVHDIVLPWFAATRDPARLVEAAPEALLGPFAFALDLVEYLISRGEREQARLLIERVTALEPKQRESFEDGRALARQGSMSRPAWHTPTTLGWSAAVHDLV
jgi:hypothetical protein